MNQQGRLVLLAGAVTNCRLNFLFHRHLTSLQLSELASGRAFVNAAPTPRLQGQQMTGATMNAAVLWKNTPFRGRCLRKRTCLVGGQLLWRGGETVATLILAPWKHNVTSGTAWVGGWGTLDQTVSSF